MASSTRAHSYAERYCEYHEIDPNRFTSHLLRYSLHAPLRWLWPVIGWSLRDTYELERNCVESIGKLRRRDDVYTELAEYSYNPMNTGLLRRKLRQRLSTRRILKALASLPRATSEKD